MGARCCILPIALLIAWGAHGPRTIGQDALADALWRKIQSVDADSPRMVETNEYWISVAFNAREEFYLAMRAMEAGERPAAMERLVRQFGREGPGSDFRLLCCDMRLSFPSLSAFAYEGTGCDREWITKVRELFCMHIVKRCLRDRSFLKRYYHAVVWSGTVFGGPGEKETSRPLMSLQLTRKGMARGDKDQYWWWARNAVVLLYAFGLEESLEDAKADELDSLIISLSRAMEGLSGSLVPDVKEFRWRAISDVLPAFSLPEAPFPDWDMRTPVPDRKVVLIMHATVPFEGKQAAAGANKVD